MKKIYLFVLIVFSINLISGCSLESISVPKSISVAGYEIFDEFFDYIDVVYVNDALKSYKDYNISLSEDEIIFIIIEKGLFGSCFNITITENANKIYYVCSKLTKLKVYELKNKTLHDVDFIDYYDFAKIYYRDRNPDGFMTPDYENFYMKKMFAKLVNRAYRELNKVNSSIQSTFENIFEELVEEAFHVDFSFSRGRATIKIEEDDSCYPSSNNCLKLESWVKGMVLTTDSIEYGYIRYKCSTLSNRHFCSSKSPQSIKYINVRISTEFKTEISIIYDLARKLSENPSSITEQDFLNYNQLMKNDTNEKFFFNKNIYLFHNAKALLDEILNSSS